MKTTSRRTLQVLATWAGIASGFWALGAPAAAATRKSRTLEGFEIAKEPTPSDWRFFIKAPDASREKLWVYQTHRGKHLKDWAWGWRLGWVRVCGDSRRPYCSAVLREALLDKALVVRAEAATRMGRRFEGTANAKAVAVLIQAYKNQRNSRNGQLMFVHNRILFALRQIGGEQALTQGRLLASAHNDAKAYWAKLEAINE